MLTSNYKHMTAPTNDGVVYAKPCHLRSVVIGKALTAGTVAIHDCATEAAAADAVDEQQTVTIDATGGTFKLTFDGQQTAAIAFDATAAAVKSALEALSNIDVGDVAVAGSAGGPYTVTFQGQYAGTNVSQMTSDATALTGGAHTAVVATTVAGSPGNKIATLALDVARAFPFADVACSTGLVAIVSGTTDVTVIWG